MARGVVLLWFGVVAVAFMVVIFSGLPFLGWVVERQWSRTQIASHTHTRMESTPAAFFEPLDLGPDLIKWPSEAAPPEIARPVLAWPSTQWPEGPFGSKPVPAEATSQPEPKQKKKPAPPAQSAPTSRGLVQQPRQRATAPVDGLPSGPQIQQLIATTGFVATIQHLMRTHGWTLEQATTFVARSQVSRD